MKKKVTIISTVIIMIGMIYVIATPSENLSYSLLSNANNHLVNIDGTIQEQTCIRPTGGSTTIYFDSNSGSAVQPMTVCTTCSPTPITLPTPVRNGYMFEGWYYDANLTIEANIEENHGIRFTTPIIDSSGCPTNQSKVTLYAKWGVCVRPTGGLITVNFVTNGGNTLSPLSICTTCSPEPVNIPAPTRSGYTFEGWYYDANLTRKANINSDGTNIESTEVPTNNGCPSNHRQTTLYAKWTKNQVQCVTPTGTATVISFETNGGNKLDKFTICTTCSPTQISLPTPSRQGYTFAGWYFDANLTQKANITSSTSSIPTAKRKIADDGCPYGEYTATLYAKWTKNNNNQKACVTPTGGNMTINFETNGGKELNVLSYCTVCAEQSITLPTPTRDKYTFVGWYFDQALTKPANITTNHSSIPSFETKKDSNGCPTNQFSTTLYAKWKLQDENVPGIRITFETDGGSDLDNDVIKVGEDLPIPEKEGYIFEGWYTDKDYTKEIKTIDPEDITNNKEIIVYAKWKEKTADKEVTPIDNNKTEKKVNNNKNRTLPIIIAAVIIVSFILFATFKAKVIKTDK